MRLVCNGVALDLLAGATLSFKKVNPLFAFDDVSCERTQAFTIPSTPTNESVLNLAKLPAWSGEGMRRRFDCEMQDGTVVKQGYLHVDSYDGQNYKAVFITGDLIGLKRIKDAGKLSDIWHPLNTSIYGGTEYNANIESKATDAYAFDNIRYARTNGYAIPSVSLDFVVKSVADQLGVTVNVPQEVKNTRIVPPYAHGISEQKIRIENINIGDGPVTDDDPVDPFNEIYSGSDVLVPTHDVIRTYGRRADSPTYSKEWSYLIATLHATQSISMRFPANFPEGVFLCNVQNGVITFLGGYSFDKSVYSYAGETYDDATGQCVTTDAGTVTGTPLAGREVQIPAGSHIIFLTRMDYVHSQTINYYYKNDWAFLLLDYEYDVTIQGSEEEITTRGEVVRLADNLPDVTFTELLKIIGYLSGRSMNYSAGGVVYDDLQLSNWPIKDITGKIMQYGEMRRTFADYAQANNVMFETDDAVLLSEELKRTYHVQNENIEQDKELARIPFSPSGIIIENAQERAYVRNEIDGEAVSHELFMLMRTNGASGDTYMHRVELPENYGITMLCDESTCINVDVRMPLFEFEELSATTAILCAGTMYVWTEATWSNGTAKIKMSKFS